MENFKVASVACGSNHTVVALDDGGVASWGASDFGQCGLETSALQVGAMGTGCVMLRVSSSVGS